MSLAHFSSEKIAFCSRGMSVYHTLVVKVISSDDCMTMSYGRLCDFTEDKTLEGMIIVWISLSSYLTCLRKILAPFNIILSEG